MREADVDVSIYCRESWGVIDVQRNTKLADCDRHGNRSFGPRLLSGKAGWKDSRVRRELISRIRNSVVAFLGKLGLAKG